MAEINVKGIEAFLKEFKEMIAKTENIVERAERVEQSLIKLLGAEDTKKLVEEMEHLKKRIDSNMKVTQDGIKLDGMTKEEIAKVAYVFNPYSATRKEKYLQGELVEQHGKLYKCKKDHKADYQNMPNLDTENEFWEEVTGTGEVVEKKKERENYQHDKTYRLNDEVVYYRKPYKYINEKPEAGKNPERDSDYWKVIEE